jgi:hypothetical protein
VTVCVAGKLRIDTEPVIVAVVNVTDGVPLIEAVTEPICAVPDPIVTPCVAICVKVTDGVPIMLVDPVMTAVPKVTDACVKVTVCVAGKLRIEVEPVTTAVPKVTDASEKVTEGIPDIVAVTLPPMVTADARSCASVRPPVIVTWPSVTVIFSRAFIVFGPSSTPETAVAISVIACVPKDTTVWAGI